MSEQSRERKQQSEQYTSSPASVSDPQSVFNSDAFHSQLPNLDPTLQHTHLARQAQSPNYQVYPSPAHQTRSQNVFSTAALRSALPDQTTSVRPPNSQAATHAQDSRRDQFDVGSSSTSFQNQQNVAYGLGGYANPTTFGTNYQPLSQYPGEFVQAIGGLYQPAPGAPAQRSRLDGYPITPFQQLPPQYYYVPGVYEAQGLQGPVSPVGSAPYAGRISTALAPVQIPSYAPVAAHDGLAALRQVHNAQSGSTPRGPPRKPKQSGFALWVGNLPQAANIVDLKDHFSRDATREIESLFLISKSNCAFVNYRTEAACAAAMQRFHDSRFQGVRLVCRLRRGPTSNTNNPEPLPEDGPVPDAVDSEIVEESKDAGTSIPAPVDFQTTAPKSPAPSSEEITIVPEKFFIIKSLTLQDLETSVRTGIWATQAHNEQALNNAFNTAKSVYLVFSANKSGEYYGYARMLSEIKSDATHIVQSLSTPQTTAPAQLPRTIATPKTATAPKGHVIDDSARGTIFWEAELSGEEAHETIDSATRTSVGPEPVFGKPFQVEWLSTTRVPFFRTRGLRNAWNSNREVKIARDGTELEPGVGRRLIQLFHRTGPAVPGGVDPSMTAAFFSGQAMPPYSG